MFTMFDVVPNLSFFDRVTLGELYVRFSHLDELLIVLVKRLDFPFGKIFDIDQIIASALHRRNYLVKLQMNCLRVLVLRTLNEKDHQEGYYRRAGINYKLPGVREVKQWACQSPNNNHRQSENERH